MSHASALHAIGIVPSGTDAHVTRYSNTRIHQLLVTTRTYRLLVTTPAYTDTGTKTGTVECNSWYLP